MTTPTPRPHAEMQIKFASDDSLKAWLWDGSTWLKREHPNWYSECFHFVGHTKPTAPPKRMCELGGFVFEAPESVAPKSGEDVYIINLLVVMGYTRECWCNTTADRRALANGLVHLNPEAAELHSRALQAVNLAAVTGGVA
jgi:hypothetical protein